jgi:hypothetical protein
MNENTIVLLVCLAIITALAGKCSIHFEVTHRRSNAQSDPYGQRQCLEQTVRLEQAE